MSTEREYEVLRYRQRPVDCHAFKFSEEIGAGEGVKLKPQKHKSNPKDFYIKNRFGKEEIVLDGDFIIKRQDGSCEKITEAEFVEKWAEVEEPTPGNEAGTLEDMTVPVLAKLAGEKGIDAKGMKKQEIIDILRKADESAKDNA